MESMRAPQAIRPQPRRTRRTTAPAPESAPARMPLSVALWPWRWALALLALALVLALGLLLARELRAALDPLERQARALELARAAQVEAALTPYDATAGAALTLLLPAALGVALLLVLAGGVVGLAVAWRRWASPPVVVLDQAGSGLELPALDQHPAHPTRLVLDQRPRRTQRPALASADEPAEPPVLVELAQPTGQPSTRAGLVEPERPTGQLAPAVELERPAAVVIPGPAPQIDPPAFLELLQAGLIGPQLDGRRALVLGYDPAQAQASGATGYDAWAAGLVRGSWLDLYSAGLGGLQGTGKTWTAAQLLMQAALNGARILLIDPAAGDPESLAARAAGPLAPALLAAPATTAQDIRAALLLVQETIERRATVAPLERWPLVVALDEWLRLLRYQELAPLVIDTLDRITTEGRRLEVHALMISHRWAVSETGRFRNSLAAAYVHRLRPEDARMLTGLRAADLPDDLLRLPKGTAYLLDTSGELRRVALPRTDQRALEAASALLLPAAPLSGPAPEVERRPFGFRPSPVVELSTPAKQVPEVEQRQAEPASVVIELAPEVERPAIAGEVPATVTSADTSPSYPPEVPAQCAGSDSEVTNVVTSTASQSGAAPTAPSAEAARVLALFQAGKSIPEIVAEVWEVRAGRGGQQYQRLNAQVQDIIRAALVAAK